ncbi:MAG: glycosyltransferase [Fibrobacterales bacterium]
MVNGIVDVSVVIPCYNASETIVRALTSVVQQTVQPLEVVIVDDCSTDNSVEWIDRYVEESSYNIPIRLIKQPINGGPSKARNRGVSEAQGLYISFLDSDDAWYANKLELQYQYMVANPDLLMTGHKYSTVDTDNWVPQIQRASQKLVTVSKRALLKRNWFATSTVMVKKSKDIRFDEAKKYSEDYLLWLQLTIKKGDSHYFDIPLAYYFKAAYGASGLSSNMHAMWQGEMDNFKKLYASGHISFIEKFGAQCLSCIKYWRRLVLTMRKSNG